MIPIEVCKLNFHKVKVIFKYNYGVWFWFFITLNVWRQIRMVYFIFLKFFWIKFYKALILTPISPSSIYLNKWGVWVFHIQYDYAFDQRTIRKRQGKLNSRSLSCAKNIENICKNKLWQRFVSLAKIHITAAYQICALIYIEIDTNLIGATYICASKLSSHAT